MTTVKNLTGATVVLTDADGRRLTLHEASFAQVRTDRDLYTRTYAPIDGLTTIRDEARACYWSVGGWRKMRAENKRARRALRNLWLRARGAFRSGPL